MSERNLNIPQAREELAQEEFAATPSYDELTHDVSAAMYAYELNPEDENAWTELQVAIMAQEASRNSMDNQATDERINSENQAQSHEQNDDRASRTGARMGGVAASEARAASDIEPDAVPEQGTELSDEPDSGHERENAEPYTLDEAQALLTYVDIYYDGVLTDDAREYAEAEKPSAYVAELMQLSEQHGRDAVKELSDEIRADYDSLIASISDFTPGSMSVADSVTWSMWDIAKQSYMTKHPEKTNENYVIADPFDPAHRADKLREISSRHVGWELNHAMDQRIKRGESLQEYITAHVPEAARDELTGLLIDEEGGKKYIRHSYEYTRIGEILRGARED